MVRKFWGGGCSSGGVFGGTGRPLFMSEPTAKAVGTVGIWAATALIMACGVFRANWNGYIAMSMMLVVVVVVCAAASISTAAVWGWRRATHVPVKRPEKQQRGAEPGTPPNGGPATSPGNWGVTEGPPSVS